jgi:mannose-1-phosphate guanylyltransferase
MVEYPTAIEKSFITVFNHSWNSGLFIFFLTKAYITVQTYENWRKRV